MSYKYTRNIGGHAFILNMNFCVTSVALMCIIKLHTILSIFVPHSISMKFSKFGKLQFSIQLVN